MAIYFIIPDGDNGGEDQMVFATAISPEEALRVASAEWAPINFRQLKNIGTVDRPDYEGVASYDSWRVWNIRLMPGPMPGILPWDQLDETRWESSHDA